MIDVRIASQHGEWLLGNAVGQIGEVAANQLLGAPLRFEQATELPNELWGTQAFTIAIIVTTHDKA